jgi:hypothetical protein
MTGTTAPLVPTVKFTFDDVDYIAVADHMTMVRYEAEDCANKSFGYALMHLERVSQKNEMPKFSELGYLVQAMLGQHHPGIGLDLAIKMAVDPDVMSQLSAALGTAMPTGKKDANRPLAVAAKKPPAKRKARKTSATGKD